MISQPVEQQDTEIILGTGKLLAIFFGLVAVCGTFFGLGYSLGRSSSPMALQSGQPSKMAASAGAKPLAGVTVNTPTAAATPATDPNAAANSQVDQVPPANQTSPSDVAVVQAASTQTDQRKTARPELTPEAGNITVQVAA